MKIIPSLKNSHLLQKPFYFLIGLVTKTLNHYLDFYCSSPNSSARRPMPEYFTTSDGRQLPVFNDYRNSIKPGWKYFPTLTALHLLIQKGLVGNSVRHFFKDAIGTRTLERSLSEIDEVARGAIFKHRDLFFPESLATPFWPTIIPTEHDIRARVSTMRKSHKVLFSKLNSFGISFPTRGDPKILEIGYISGGYSLFAFESLGFQTLGIDNYYGDNAKRNPLPQYISAKLSSKVAFRLGDITRTTEFDDEEMDIVYSSSVLEHLSSLPEALAEMSRILKRDGLMIHNYNPFFCPNGGHALGILDCPWGHVRVCREDYLRYMDELRPFEYESLPNNGSTIA